MLPRIAALSVLIASSFGGAANAQNYVVRVPVASSMHAPSTVTHHFGNALVGSAPQRQFTFTNRGATATTLSPLTILGSANVLSHDCTGTLAPQQSCTLKVALQVNAAGAIEGEVRVAHSEAGLPDSFILKANGIEGAGLLRFTEGLLDFGDQSIKTTSAAKTVELLNDGADPVDINAITVADAPLHYTITDSTCESTLAPQQRCSVKVVFNPQSSGTLQGKLAVELGDGTKIAGAGLLGNGVQGVVSWSTSQLNFVKVPVGQKSAVQTATLTNTGKGAFDITSLKATGDTAFEVVSTTCGARLEAGRSCTISLAVTPSDATIRTGSLEMRASGASQTVTRVQLYAAPVLEQAILEVTPAALDFGANPLGQAKQLTLALKSTGNKPVSVTGYRITGTGAAQFATVNAAACTGTLEPGMQCDLTVSFTPSATAPQSAQLFVDADTPEPVPAISLAGEGAAGALSVLPGSLDFGSVELGKDATLTATLKNSGNASLTVNNLAMTAATSAGYSATGCVSQTLAPEASCTLSVKFTPTATGTKSSSIVINHTGSPATSTLAVTGNAIPAPVPTASLGAFTCPAPAQTNVAFNCTASLSNTGTIPVTVGAASRTGTTFGAPTHNCGTSLAVGANCTITVPATIASAGSYSTTVSVSTGAGAKSGTASVTVQAPQATLTIRPHGSTQINTTVSATHLVANTGSFPVSLTLPATVNNAVFNVTGTTCTSSLAPGATCNITTSCTPTAASSYNANLSLATTAGTLTQPITCTGELPPPSGSSLTATPNPVDGGSLTLGQSTTRAFTLRNNSISPIQVTALTLAGSNVADFSFTSNCVTTLAANGTCTGTVTIAPKALGSRVAEIRLTTNAADTPAPISLKATGVQGILSAQPSSLDFGVGTVGTAASKTVSLLNTGDAPVSVTSAPVVSGTDAARYAVSSNCTNVAIAPGGSCALTVTFTPTTTAATTASIRLNNNGRTTTVDVPVSGSAQPAPTAAATLSDFACSPTAVQSGQSFTCTATLSSTGQLALGYTSVSRSNTAFGAPTSNCPASMPVGTSCTITMTSTLTTAGNQSSNVSVATSVGTLTKSVSMTVTAPSIGVLTQPHGNVQIGYPKEAAHTLTNRGTAAVTLRAPTVTGTGFSYVGTTCAATLAPGASCQYTTRCSPTAAGALTGTFTANVEGASASGGLTCQGVTGSGSVSPTGPTATDVGAYSKSGNWYRLTNTGQGPLTIQALYPANVDWTLFTDAANAGHCTVNKVLQAGQDCLVMEVLNTGNPGMTYTGTQRVRTSIGDLSWGSSMRAYGASITEWVSARKVPYSQTIVGQYIIKNLAPYPIQQLAVTWGGTGTIAENGCTSTLAAAGQPGDSCTLKVNVTGPANSTTNYANRIYVDGGYAQVINGVANAMVGKGRLASLDFLTSGYYPQASWTVGAYPKAAINGGSSTAVHTLTNNATGPVTINSVAAFDNTAFTVDSSTCTVNRILQPAESCTVTGRFTPADVGTFTANMAIRVSGTNFTTKVTASSYNPDVTIADWTALPPSAATNCGYWGFLNDGTIQCNRFNIVFPSGRNYPSPSPSYLDPYRLANALNYDGPFQYQYPGTVRPGCGAWDKLDAVNGNRFSGGPGKLFSGPSGKIYAFQTCWYASKPTSNSTQYRQFNPMLVILNADGTFHKTIQVGSVNDVNVPFTRQQAVVDEARGIAWMPSPLYFNDFQADLVKVDLNTGAVLEKLPKYLMTFAYDHGTGLMYFVPNSDYWGNNDYLTKDYLMRRNADGTLTRVNMDRAVSFSLSNPSLTAWNGKIIFSSYHDQKMYLIDTNVSPAKVSTVMAGVGGGDMIHVRNGWAYSIATQKMIKMD